MIKTRILLQALTQKKYSKLSNKKMSEMMGVSQGTFYGKYGGRNDVLEKVLLMELEDTLIVLKKDNCELFIDRALKKIEQDKYLFLSMLEILDKNAQMVISKNLRNRVIELLKQYPDEREGIAKKDLMARGASMYETVYYWISHGFTESRIDVYNRLKHHFGIFEGYKDGYKPPYQK